ncbi:MAG TPA: zinc-binding dehydrogenase [Anaerolineales bacterium]|nr:zinc-binding dehydrogenase [Anaerolineales bacterium]
MVKAVRVNSPHSVQVVDVEPRKPGRGEIRLKVEAVGVCGSDVALLAGKHPYATYPVIPGHELSGKVIGVAGNGGLAVGQRVTVRPLLTCGVCRACRDGRLNHCPEVRVLGVHVDGGMAEEVIVPESTVFPVPDGMDAEEAAMVEPTAVAVHVAHRAGIVRGSTVAIFGTGVIGLLALQVAKAAGARAVLCIDRVRERLSLAGELGASRVVDSRNEDIAAAAAELCPDGFDVVLEMVGAETTMAQALDLARRGGAVVMVALPHGSASFDFEMLYRKELTLAATRLYAGDFAEAISLIAAGQVAVQPLITHRFRLSEGAQAMSLPGENPAEAIKVMIRP